VKLPASSLPTGAPSLELSKLLVEVGPSAIIPSPVPDLDRGSPCPSAAEFPFLPLVLSLLPIIVDSLLVEESVLLLRRFRPLLVLLVTPSTGLSVVDMRRCDVPALVIELLSDPCVLFDLRLKAFLKLVELHWVPPEASISAIWCVLRERGRLKDVNES
jgi:hypothetical protein